MFQIKTGAPCRSERLAKYNQVRTSSVPFVTFFSIPFLFLCSFANHPNYVSVQLLRIEEELGNVRYAGEAFRSP